MALLLLAFLLADILSIAFPFIAYYLWHEWHTYHNTLSDDYADRCLYAAIALGVLILLGRFLIKALLSKRRPGEDQPHMFRPLKQEFLERPDGSRINIEHYGKQDGQPIVFVHGMNANTQNWYYQRKRFETEYRIIMMDLAGLGKSTRPRNKDFSLSKMAGDLAAVIEHTGAHNAILWGHSMGGMTILTLLTKLREASRLPVKAAILEHTTYTNPVRTMLFSKVMTALQKPVLTPICWLIIILSPLIWISRWMSYLNGNAHIMTRWLTFAGTQTPKQLDFTTLLSTVSPPAVMARGVLAMFRYDVTTELPSINVPVLIIGANKDRLTKPEASIYMKQHIANAQLTVVSPGNHQSLIERHHEVNQAAARFIEALR
jgi:pimeloyl-ACP methyl ester carboxylesterase